MTAIQEHWLYRFEAIFLEKLCNDLDLDCTIRCCDDNDPIPLYQRPRGYGGTALIWKRQFSSLVSCPPDGTARILPIVIQNDPRNLCLISVYLPSRGNHSESEYAACLDELSVLHSKFSAANDVVILGDFNASLIDNRCPRDLKFSAWCYSLGVAIKDNYPRDGTHKHYRGTGYSTIDYILTSKQDILSNIKVDVLSGVNTSSHYPVMATRTCSLGLPSRSSRLQTKSDAAVREPNLNWNK